MIRYKSTLILSLLLLVTSLRAINPGLTLLGASMAATSINTALAISEINTDPTRTTIGAYTRLRPKIVNLAYVMVINGNKERKQKIDWALKKIQYVSLAVTAGGLGLMAYGISR